MAATISRAAAAVETSSATINFRRGSFFGESSLRGSKAGETAFPSLPGMRWGRVVCIPSSVRRLVQFRQRVIGGYGLIDRPVMRRTRLHDIEPDPLQAALLKLQSLRRAVGKVNNAPLYDRSAIVHFYHHRSSVPQVRHPHIAS